jgi:hypothetical protein
MELHVLTECAMMEQNLLLKVYVKLQCCPTLQTAERMGEE